MTKTIEEIADIVEFHTWATRGIATVSALKNQLEASLSAEEKDRAETMAQNVLDEFQNRQKTLGSAYPFVTDGYKLEVSHPEPSRTAYIFCLGLSVLPATQIENEQRCLQFETLVMVAAKSFFGGEGLRIGAPWRSEDVPEYGNLLDKVTELIPNLGEKLRTTAPDGGDAGWDVLIVKNFRDNMIPRFIAMGNCATGRTDWKRKGLETQPTLFWSYFQSDHRSVFIVFFAVPFTMDEEARLRKLSTTSMTFDRFRICEHAPVSPVEGAVDWLEGQRQNALEIPLN
ncbi:MAG TPA: hypothetical protein VNY24_03390 [Candidatus Acidoferrales bacterium]|jgi:hypothetical protein|nr:hypothetical protein [Candidatus Acidoferrales bacterium]